MTSKASKAKAGKKTKKPASTKTEATKHKSLHDLETTDDTILFRDYGDENGDLVIACGFRIFINGVDVSAHVMAGSIAYGFQPRGNENSLTFVLDNNNGKFELRGTNLGISTTQYDSKTKKADNSQTYADSESYATSAPWKITKMFSGYKASYIASKNAESHGLTTFSEVAKRSLYLGKLKQRVNLTESSTTTGNVKMNLTSKVNPNTGIVGNEEQKDISLYEGLFSTKSSVINVNDQVRLFIPDPNRDTPVRADTLWMCAFTGFVISAPPEHDFTTGQSSISIQCSDIRTQLKRKRVLVNATTADQITPTIGLRSGLFADLTVTNNTTSSGLADASFTFEKLMSFVLTGHRIEGSDTVKSMCCGPDASLMNPPASYTSKKSTQATDNKSGFGQIWFGHYFEYDVKKFKGDTSAVKTARAAFMNKWNRLCVFGPTSQYLTWDGMQTMGKGTYRYGDFDALKVFVHFLVPTSGAQITNLLDRTFIDQLGVQREYMSIQEIIDQVCERLDYCVSVTGAGDITFEFPMYDFTPEDMGVEFQAVCAVSDSVKNHTLNDESNSNPVTGLRVVGGYTDSTAGPGAVDGTVQAQLYTIYLVHELLAYRYGPIIEDYSIPSINNGPISSISQDVYQRQLTVFGVIEFLKRLSEMSSMSISSIFNPFIRPNRPYYYNYGRRLGTTEGIDNTLTLFSSAETTVNSRYIRRIDDVTGEFIAFSGSKSLPLRYSESNTLEAWTNLEDFDKFQTNLYKAGINIMLADNTPVTDANGHVSISGGMKSTVKNNVDRLCNWTAEQVAALDKLCAKVGAKRADLLAVMAAESRGIDTSQVNHDTYATGLNQITPDTALDLLRWDSTIISSYPTAVDLLQMAGGADKLPKDKRSEFSNRYLQIFSTTEDQLFMYGEFLAHARVMSKVGSSYKFDSITKLAQAQMAPGSLKSSNYYLSDDAQSVNGGLTSTTAYAARIKRDYDAQSKRWASVLGTGNCGGGSNKFASTSTTTVGGTGSGSSTKSYAPTKAGAPTKSYLTQPLSVGF